MSRAASTLSMLLVLGGAGCATYADHMRAGRWSQACFAAQKDPKTRDHFDHWAEENVKVSARLVPAADIERELGGPLAGYGVTVGVYELDAVIPGAATDWATEVFRGAAAPYALVDLLPPLVMTEEPLLPPGPVDVADLQPAPAVVAPPAAAEALPEYTDGSWSAAFGAIAEGAWRLGRTFGGALLAPAAGSLGMVAGGVEMLMEPARLLGRTPEDNAPPQHKVPMHVVRPPKVTGRLDALLDEREHAALAASRRAEWEAQRAAVASEHARRVVLLDNLVNVLRICHDPGCRYVLVPGKISAVVAAQFLKGDDNCVVSPRHDFEAPAAPSTRPAWPRPTLVSPIAVEDLHAPAWAAWTPASSALAWNAAPAAITVENLLCAVEPGRMFARAPVPPLSIRVTAGRETSRVQRFFLGPVRKGAMFVVPGVHLRAGERLRFSFADAATGRHLGGGITEMSGALPLVAGNDALRVRCTEAPDGALAAEVSRLDGRVRSDLVAMTEAMRTLQPLRVSRARVEARTSMATLAMHAGWESSVATAAMRAFAETDPAERP